MLTRLSIRDIVLIDKLDLELCDGLTVLTGETGAGKSIVLDSLGLALGSRADRSIVREGAGTGSVSARFELPPDHTVAEILDEHGLIFDGDLLLRRTIGTDGRSRAFVNDEPIGITLLRRIGAALVEIHGQMDQHGLMDTKTHRGILDAMGELDALADDVAGAYAAWREAVRTLDTARQAADQAGREEAYLRHRRDELEKLAVEPGEEARLAGTRQRLMDRDKLIETLRDALDHIAGQGGAVERLGIAQRRMDRSSEPMKEALAAATAAIERALIEASEAESTLSALLEDAFAEDGQLEAIEDRLFAIRDVARKYRLQVEDLPDVLAETIDALDMMEAGERRLSDLANVVDTARTGYIEYAKQLTEQRQLTADELAKTVTSELAPLKLDRARFRVSLVPIEEDEFGPNGCERVAFEISTNPGQPFGPLGKIASGGELSRLMLALKVVLSSSQTTHSMVFDEVDSGIGGATADAVGERLARLAHDKQVLVVTHAPQVAARAQQHLTVLKRVRGGQASVQVTVLSEVQRRNEIARMLSGAKVTEAARAAADSLMLAAAE